ncbi:hypothetical protein AC578_4833 [Pseudocercospora eumusae]|uniref:F-box domain-containing protein n=1 Tax=Pseudocercospora eumusae TaxID=321146 RepID=A0A139HL42_9PEZI|nr:hypothetical protein AC578_4833 [Pseudocercospora eumusae]
MQRSIAPAPPMTWMAPPCGPRFVDVVPSPLLQRAVDSKHFTRYLQYQHQKVENISGAFVQYRRALIKVLQYNRSYILERILLHIQDVRTLLRCKRVCRIFNAIIKTSVHLERALWLRPTPRHESGIHFLTHPSDPDPLITWLRSELDLFIQPYSFSTRCYTVLYCPTGGTSKRSRVAREWGRQLNLWPCPSWRSMCVMRGAEKNVRWKVAMHHRGYFWSVELGEREWPPCFAEVMARILELAIRC